MPIRLLIFFALSILLGACSGSSQRFAQDPEPGNPNGKTEELSTGLDVPTVLKRNLTKTLIVSGVLESTSNVPNVSIKGEGYTPPLIVGLDAKTLKGRPAVAEWTRVAKPGDTILISGTRFSSYSGNFLGKDTQFWIYSGETNPPQWTLGQIRRLQADKVALTIPSTNPYSMYLIVPVNQSGTGPAFRVNAPQLWWADEKVDRGERLRLYGRNLTYQRGSSTRVYAKCANELTGRFLTTTTANPYKIDLIIPSNFPFGQCEFWVNAIQGGSWGWSNSLRVTIEEKHRWSGDVYNVKDFGAVGDGIADDWSGISAAFQAAALDPYSTVYFPNGTYSVSGSFFPAANMRILGESRSGTVIKANSNYYSPPGVYSPKHWSMFFSFASNIEFRNLTVDANHSLNGMLNYIGYFRGGKDLRFENVSLNAASYIPLDIHDARGVFFKNADIVGLNTFLGSAKQVSFEGVNFYQTNDSLMAVLSWGADGVSISDCTAQDWDINDPMHGWGAGRFFTSQGLWGSNSNLYIGDTKMIQLAPNLNNPSVNANQGEIVMQEGAHLLATQRGVSASSNTVTISGLTASVVGNYVAIVDGTGSGQFRLIRAHDMATGKLTLANDWNLPPDSTSTVQVGVGLIQASIFRNEISGKQENVFSSTANASSGVQAYGGVLGWEVANNRIEWVRTGLSNWGTNGPGQQALSSQFNLYLDNTIENVLEGIADYGWDYLNLPTTSQHLFANVFRNNAIANAFDRALTVTNAVVGTSRRIDMELFEGNKGTQVTGGFAVKRTGNSHQGDRFAAENILLLNNTFSAAGGAYFSCLSVDDLYFPLLQKNVCTGFDGLFDSYLQEDILEVPERAVSLIGPASSSTPTAFSIGLDNGGTGTLTYFAQSNVSWISLSRTTGQVSGQKSATNLVVTVTPPSTAPGTYEGYVTLTTLQGTIKTIAFKVELN